MVWRTLPSSRWGLSFSLASRDTTKTKRPGEELVLVGPSLARSATSRRVASGIGRSCHQRWVRASRKSWSRAMSDKAGNGGLQTKSAAEQSRAFLTEFLRSDQTAYGRIVWVPKVQIRF